MPGDGLAISSEFRIVELISPGNLKINICVACHSCTLQETMLCIDS